MRRRTTVLLAAAGVTLLFAVVLGLRTGSPQLPSRLLSSPSSGLSASTPTTLAVTASETDTMFPAAAATGSTSPPVVLPPPEAYALAPDVQLVRDATFGTPRFAGSRSAYLSPPAPGATPEAVLRAFIEANARDFTLHADDILAAGQAVEVARSEIARQELADAKKDDPPGTGAHDAKPELAFPVEPLWYPLDMLSAVLAWDVRLGRRGRGPPLPGTAYRVFDYPLSFTSGTRADYVEAAQVQAFYVINLFHDRLWNLGFDEAAGNFQSDNFGRGGLQGDPLRVEVQNNYGITRCVNGLEESLLCAPAPRGSSFRVLRVSRGY